MDVVLGMMESIYYECMLRYGLIDLNEEIGGAIIRGNICVFLFLFVL